MEATANLKTEVQKQLSDWNYKVNKLKILRLLSPRNNIHISLLKSEKFILNSFWNKEGDQ